MTDGTMIKKHNIALFLNAGTKLAPDWKQISKSTDNTINMNGETRTFDYITDEAPTDEVERYKPSLSQPITMYKGNPDFEFVFDKFFKLATGNDAHSEILIEFRSHKEGGENKAWKASCILVIDNLNPIDSTITVNINFNGTVDKGTVQEQSGMPVFTSTTVKEFAFTVTVLDGTAEKDALVQIGGVSKKTNINGEAVFILLDGETYTVGASKGTKSASEVFEADDGITELTLNLV